LGIATSETDSVAALAMTALAGAGFMSSVAGKVSNALQHAPTFGNSTVSRCANAALASNGSGFTVVGWMNTSDVLGDATTQTAISYQFNQNAVTYIFNIARYGPTGGGTNWIIEWGVGPAATTITIPSGAGWRFYAATMNLITGLIVLTIDQLTTANDTVAAPAAGAHTTGSVLCVAGPGLNPGSSNTSLFDEVGLFNSVLSSAQLDFIYNSGSGRTYPF